MPVKRIKRKFEELAGKTIARLGYGGQFFWMIFTDGTWVWLDGCQWSMRYDGDPFPPWTVEMGLMSQEEWDRQQAETKKRIEEATERREREVLAELQKKYSA